MLKKVIDYSSCPMDCIGNCTPLKQETADIIQDKTDWPNNVSKVESDLVKTEDSSNGESCAHKCSHCGRILPSDVALTLHILCAHVPVECDICGITLSSLSQAGYHKDLVHKKSSYNCPKCSKKFLYKNPFETHVSICGSKTVSCNFCSGLYKSEFLLRDHQKRRCRGAKQVQNANTSLEVDENKGKLSAAPPETISEDYNNADLASVRLQNLQAQFGSNFSTAACPYCEKKVANVKRLYSHIRSNHHEYSCEVCGQTSAGLIKHRAHEFACHKKAQFRCHTCGMEFRYKGRFRAHFATCKLKKHSCEICGQLFRFASAIARHKKMKHSGKGGLENVQIKVDQAEAQRTEMKTSLAKHDDQEHAMAKPPIMRQNSDDHEVAHASDCGYSHDDNAHDNKSVALTDIGLIGKGKTKAKEISHSCSICGIGFSNYRQAYNHKLAKHTVNYQCPLCAKGFAYKTALDLHTPNCAKRKHCCELCGRKFRSHTGVKRHKKRLHYIEESSGAASAAPMEYTEEMKSDEPLSDSVEEIVAKPGSSKQDANNCTDAEKNPSIPDEAPFVIIHDVKKLGDENMELNVKIKAEKSMLHEELHYSPSSNTEKPTIASAVMQTELQPKVYEVRLVFRCEFCSWDYTTKEALWNHLNLHEIADENKELHYQEMKANHELYQCDLCNDQRAYSESSFQNHVRDEHEGLLLRCTDCGETFRSEKHKNDHRLNQCLIRNQPGHTSHEVCNMLLVKSEPTTSYNSVPDMENCITEKGADILPPVETVEKDSQLFSCDICGINFPSNHAAYYHKKTKHGQTHKCPHCRRLFLIEDYNAHLVVCEKGRISCKLCDVTFELQRNLTRHMKRIHHVGRKVKKQPDKKKVSVSFDCDMCGRTFPSYHLFHYHKRKDHGRTHKCPHCRSLFKLDEYQNHLTLCQEKSRLSCEICHSKYRNAIYLTRHMRRVHRPKEISNTEDSDQTYGDQNCSAKIITSAGLDDADSRTTENDATEKRLQKVSKTKCPHCDKEYVTGRPFLNHLRSSHRPSDCTICGITIYGTEKARYHKIMKHTEPAFECANCSKKFHWKRDFNFHASICDPIDKIPQFEKQQAHSQPEQSDLRMEIKVEEPTLEPPDDYENSLGNAFTDLLAGEPTARAFGDGTVDVEIKKESPESEEENFASEYT